MYLLNVKSLTAIINMHGMHYLLNVHFLPAISRECIINMFFIDVKSLLAIINMYGMKTDMFLVKCESFTNLDQGK